MAGLGGAAAAGLAACGAPGFADCGVPILPGGPVGCLTICGAVGTLCGLGMASFADGRPAEPGRAEPALGPGAAVDGRSGL